MVQTFIKVANYQHIMPTRYTLDIDLKSIVTQEAVENSSKRTDARKVSLQLLSCHVVCCVAQLSEHVVPLLLCWEIIGSMVPARQAIC